MLYIPKIFISISYHISKIHILICLKAKTYISVSATLIVNVVTEGGVNDRSYSPGGVK